MNVLLIGGNEPVEADTLLGIIPVNCNGSFISDTASFEPIKYSKT